VVQVLLLGRCVNVIRSGKNMTTIRTVVSPVSTAEEKGLLNKPLMPVVTDVDMASLKVNLAKLMRDLNELFEAQAADRSGGRNHGGRRRESDRHNDRWRNSLDFAHVRTAVK
jgi:hypothetical protein